MRSGVTSSGLAYSVAGNGPPLLWLSGFVLATTALEGYVARFSGDYTCIVFDPRGSGRTRPALCRVSTTAMARDAVEVLRHLGYRSAHVQGVSLGGMVAQELAIRAPHRVRTLVLASTTAGGSAATPANVSTMLSSVSRGQTPVPGSESVSWRGALQQAYAATTHDAVSRLPRVQSPSLVMHGERDRLLPPENARRLAELLPDAELRFIRAAGHFFPMVCPEDAANIALTWMAAQGKVSPGSRSVDQQVAHLVRDVASSPVRWGRARLMPARHAYRALSGGPTSATRCEDRQVR